MIGLTEDAAQYASRGYTPTRSALGYGRFRRFGMPFQVTPKARLSATSPACRAIVATRLAAPALEDAALRALQFAQFTTTGALDDPHAALGARARRRPGCRRRGGPDRPSRGAGRLRARPRSARTAAGSPTEFQDRAANTDGAVRYTAPSLIFDGPGRQRLEAGGFQPIEAYDVVIANLDPALARRAPATDPVEVLSAFPYELATAEIAAVMAEHLSVPDSPASRPPSSPPPARNASFAGRSPTGRSGRWPSRVLRSVWSRPYSRCASLVLRPPCATSGSASRGPCRRWCRTGRRP